MRRTVVIHQPDFLPHLGFFHRLPRADLFIALDHVQFVNGTSRSWTHRDRIKTARGPRWLTVSVRSAPLHTPIDMIQLSDNGWREENLALIRENYRDAPHFSLIFAELHKLYALQCSLLVEFNLASLEMLFKLFDLDIPVIRSSFLQPIGRKNEMLVDLLGKVGATHYLSGVGARDYFEPKPYVEAGIEVLWQNFVHPVYPQLHGDFLPHLSAIDLLFNCGVEQSREILRNC